MLIWHKVSEKLFNTKIVMELFFKVPILAFKTGCFEH